MAEQEKKQDLTENEAEKPGETPDSSAETPATTPKPASLRTGGEDVATPVAPLTDKTESGPENSKMGNKAPQSVTGRGVASGAAKRAGARKKRGAKPLDAAARRKKFLREEKLRINADLKKTARKIMLAGTLSTIVAVIGLLLITTGRGAVTGKIGAALLVLGLLGFGVLGGIIYRMYNSGQEAARKKQRRQRSQMARQDVQQFISNLSVETREKLMQVDARKKVSGGEIAEAMFLKLNDDELSNALQFLCMTSRNGEVELTFDNGTGTGNLHLGDGTVLFAKYGDYEGLEAIARMLKSGAAEASFYEGRSAPGKNIDMPISGILLNASVMSDELG